MWRKSQSVHSNFCRFLSALLDSYYGSKAKEVLKRLMEDYRLGATRDGAVIFWQIDRENKVRTGKVMQYNPGDGHRVKDGQTSAVNWIHSILKRQRVLAEEWQLSQCLFGEHLLNVYPDKVAVLVESEKSAVIGSAPLPRLCMAGGRRQKPVAGGKAPCADRADRASLSGCRCLCRMERACRRHDLLQGDGV